MLQDLFKRLIKRNFMIGDRHLPFRWHDLNKLKTCPSRNLAQQKTEGGIVDGHREKIGFAFRNNRDRWSRDSRCNRRTELEKAQRVTQQYHEFVARITVANGTSLHWRSQSCVETRVH